ncbi:MAG TPA: cohesin domain-containing protein [Candidatus Hydrogenedentes bacterium]|nr:cohesin domain-containing protein [Candidatus Hydrogenedentota bacterium]
MFSWRNEMITRTPRTVFIRAINVIYITFIFFAKYAISCIHGRNFFYILPNFFCILFFFNTLIKKIRNEFFWFFRLNRLASPRRLCYTLNEVRLRWVVAGVSVMWSVAAQQAVMMPQGTVEADHLVVTVYLQGGGDGVALNYTLTYDPNILEPVSIVSGTGVNTAGKSVADNVSGPGRWTVVVMGMNREVIPDGDVATATFKIRSPEAEKIQVSVEDPVISTWDGEEIPVTGSRYEVRLNHSGDDDQEKVSDSDSPKADTAGQVRLFRGGVEGGGEANGKDKKPIGATPDQVINKTEEIGLPPSDTARENRETDDYQEGGSVNQRVNSGVLSPGLKKASTQGTDNKVVGSLTVEDEGLRGEDGELYPQTSILRENPKTIISEKLIWCTAALTGCICMGAMCYWLTFKSPRKKQ